MITQTTRTLTVRIDKQKFLQTVTVLPVLMLIMIALAEMVAMNTQPSEGGSAATFVEAVSAPVLATTQALAYPVTGSDLNPSLFAVQLPPPPLDALPYEIREPLSNGTSVPVKKRWLWLTEGTQIAVSETAAGSLKVDVPVGALWWKEFYIETDRGTFLIERRIIERAAPATSNHGWSYYSSHYLPAELSNTQMLTVSSTSNEASVYMFQPEQWLPTQQQTNFIEVRFEDARGVAYPYVFPGQTQCTACHNGEAGAYPNAESDPIFVFGLHPNNLTPESFTALVERGWMVNGEQLLTPGYLETAAAATEPTSVDTLTHDVVDILRNNCASCHNSSPRAAASFTAFQVAPNTSYNTDELVALLSGNGRMVANAFPLVTPGVLAESELWLRLNGLEGRQQMPPVEGGLPEVNPQILKLFEAWITQLDTQ